jgi:hypothetical protein
VIATATRATGARRAAARTFQFRRIFTGNAEESLLRIEGPQSARGPAWRYNIARVAHAAVSCRSLHQAWVLCPAHGVNHRVQACIHQVAQMSAPFSCSFHDRLRYMPTTQRCRISGSSSDSVSSDSTYARDRQADAAI